jgi:hypothetical protein
MTPLRSRPGARLAALFFHGMFDLGFLSDHANLSFTRLIVGVCAVFFSFGLLITRAYAAKYIALSDMPSPEPYRRAILADHVFVLALSMWVVAFVTVLVAHALFPDETDYRVLTPLPITRRLVFAAKACSVLMFAGLFSASIHVALTPLFIVISLSHWAEGLLVVRLGAMFVSNALASMFCVLAVGALQGLILLLAPPGRAAVVAAAARSVMLGALMLCLPFIARLPGVPAASLLNGSQVWSFLPPAWFLGLERWLVGDTRPALVHLAANGAMWFGAVCLVAAGSYAVLYARFERVTFRAARPPRARRARRAARRFPRRPIAFALRQFVFVTLRRSPLHQGVTLVISAIGVGFAVNSFIAHDVAGWLRTGGSPAPAVVASVLWAPFALVYVSARAVRLAFLLPIEARANWVFRMTERSASRVEQMTATSGAVFSLGVVAPVALLLPIQFRVLGAAAVAPVIATLVLGYLYVELLMKDWSRLPFTCSYIPGKGFVPQRILLATFFFVTFTNVGGAMTNDTARQSALWLAWVAAVLVAALALRRRRTGLSLLTPLEFEDVLPAELYPLPRLGPE